MINKGLGDHTGDAAPFSQNGIGDDTHEPNGRAPVDESYVLSSELSSHRNCVVSINRLRSLTGPCIDANAPYGHYAVYFAPSLRVSWFPAPARRVKASGFRIEARSPVVRP